MGDCHREAACPFLHRELPAAVCRHYLYGRCTNQRTPRQCRWRHTQACQLPPPAASEVARLRRLGTRVPRVVAATFPREEQAATIAPCPGASSPANYAAALKDTRERVSCLDCGLGFPAVRHLQQHVSGEEHRRLVAEVAAAGRQVEGLLGEGGAWWCAVCRLWVPPQEGKEAHLAGCAHLAIDRATAFLRKLKAGRVIVCQMCGVSIEVGEAEEHLHSIEHRIAVEEQEEVVKQDTFVLCEETTNLRDIHVTDIALNCHDFRSIVSKFGILTKCKVLNQPKCKGMKHAYLSYQTVEDYNRAKTLLVEEGFHLKTREEAPKLPEVYKERSFTLEQLAVRQRYPDWCCPYCPVACNAQAQLEEHVQAKHGVKGLGGAVEKGEQEPSRRLSSGEMVQGEGAVGGGGPGKTLGASSPRTPDLTPEEELVVVEQQVKEQEEAVARCQAERSTMAALQLEGRQVDRRRYMVLLQQEAWL